MMVLCPVIGELVGLSGSQPDEFLTFVLGVCDGATKVYRGQRIVITHIGLDGHLNPVWDVICNIGGTPNTYKRAFVCYPVLLLDDVRPEAFKGVWR